ncbi:kinesin-like protein CG14535 [Musca autumnalis]|uniref:kinesin-like protein CG14535 n=1 Tax=Musca autumnalis TaxID=221902 RepID=UPI003CEF0E75
MGPGADATDGEHPPVYVPFLSSGDNRGVRSKALKDCGVEKEQHSPSKIPISAKKVVSLKQIPQIPSMAGRTGSLKRGTHSPPRQARPARNINTSNNEQAQLFLPLYSVKTLPYSASSPKIVAGSIRHPGMTMMFSKASNVPSPKGSSLRHPGVDGTALTGNNEPGEGPGSPMRKITEEKVAEAHHITREVNQIK